MSVAALQALAPLFRYPDAAFPRHLDEARRVVPALETFARETAALDRTSLQITYTSTFDLAPSCSPYLGAHLFGDDSRARARLMLGLQRNGPSSELPDHIAEVLANASAFDENEWRELEELVLRPALAKMASLLTTPNPYRSLVDAVLGELRVASCESPEIPRNSQPATPNPESAAPSLGPEVPRSLRGRKMSLGRPACPRLGRSALPAVPARNSQPATPNPPSGGAP